MSQDGRDVPSAPTEDLSSGFLRPGQILGERYRIGEQLGRGGMGEVWRATDLKLRVEVALKAMREDLFRDEKRRDLLRQEVRAAREVVSPNVCRIFDLIEAEGRELVSMEYVDGGTLLDVLREHGPLDLKEAQDIASQFLAGLEAIHKAGLIHRDVKPENIMLTRAGRVVLMDFGLARQEDSGAGTVSGTPAYMAPEQAAGMKVDARADVYSAGVVLAEMVSPEGIKDLQSRESVWEGIRHEPARVPDSPWAPVLKKAVAKQPDQRYSSAHTLTRALEDVTLRVDGAEDLLPYPGLASFTETNAEYFFGREAEIEAMWARLDRPHMLAIIGPSGAGKSSFLRAGIIPAAGAGWAIATCTPGNAAFRSLRQELASQLAGDAEAMRELVDVEDLDAMVSAVSRWRRRHEHALLIVDQFEELFTQNTVEVQERFTALLERLVLEADVFVLLSLRDDFFFHCHRFEALKPVVTDLTLLGPPAGAALRRAIVRPATTCGYRFEDDELVEEMLAEVEGERGALPLLAFAMSRMWEQRDRGSGLITRQAHRDIGGVGGALAQHAESTIDRIGSDRLAIVRELFRNLVTAEGTRAVRDLGELLSIFDEGQRPAAEDVLRDLVDARLLTSYEVHEEDGEPNRRVEIIHESLLTSWPRLVGWRTQDADSTRLRDELRQAARTWDEHGRSDDHLWAGTAYREFAVWRERYPGGLSDLEDGFSRAMAAHARRRKRRRRAVTAAVFIVLLAVLAVVWASRQQAIAEANRAEASKLVTLGTMVIERDRTEALAYAIASLDRSDTQEGRRLALRALWAGPPATAMPNLQIPGSGTSLLDRVKPFALGISPGGRSMAVGYPRGMLQVFPRDGGEPITIQGFEEDQGDTRNLFFSADGQFLVGGASDSRGEVRVWRTDGWTLERTLRPPEPPELLMTKAGWSVAYGLVEPGLSTALTVTFLFGGDHGTPGHWLLRRWPLDGGPSELVGQVAGNMLPNPFPDLSRGLFAVGLGAELQLHRLGALGREPPRVIDHHPGRFSVGFVAIDPTGERLAVCDEGGILRMWPLDGDGLEPEREIEGSGCGWGLAFSPDGARLAHGRLVWDLRGPAFSQPVRILAENTLVIDVAFTPDQRWLATATRGNQPFGLTLWPMSDHYPRVLRSDLGPVMEPIFFHPDGSRFFTSIAGPEGSVKLLSWPLSGGAGLKPTKVFDGAAVAMDRRGRFLIAGGEVGLWKVPLNGDAPIHLGIDADRLDLDPTGRYVGCRLYDDSTVAVLDLETGELMHFEPPGKGGIDSRYFDRESRLLVARGGVLSRWNPEMRRSEVLFEEGVPFAAPIGDGRRVYVGWQGSGYRSILDLEDGSRRVLPQAHQPMGTITFDPTGSIAVSTHPNGDVRVGPIFSEEHHLLLGHEGMARMAGLSPDGQWIASLSADGSAYLWPMPDVSERPFHLLPYRELMPRLKALTNFRAVADETIPTGYKVEPDFTAYRGWETAPTW